MSTGIALLVLLAAVLLIGFSSGRWSVPLAAWVGPVLLIRFYRDQRALLGYLPLLLASILAAVISWWQVFPLQIIVYFWLTIGLISTLPYLADRLLAHRIGGFAGTLVFPLALSGLEFVNLIGSPVGSWGAAGYSQYGNLPLMQLVSVTGMVGISFLMGWFASISNWVWEALRLSRGKETLAGVGLYAALLATVLLYGSVRLNLAALPEQTVRVAGITPVALRPLVMRWGPNRPSAETMLKETLPIQQAYFAATIREAQAGAKLVVWPEGSGVGYGVYETDLIARARQVAREQQIYLTIPLFTYFTGGRRSENKLLLVDPKGEVVLEHVKFGGNFMEGTLKGDQRLRTVVTPFGLLSGVICWDADFTEVIRQGGQAGVNLLLIPSNDWREITPIHAQMSVFRAIENGFSVVRQTDHGLSIAADPYGRVLAQMNFFGTSDQTMVAQIPVQRVATLYTRGGYLLGWLTVIGFGVMLVWGIVGRKRA